MRQVAAGNREQLEPLVRRYASPLLTYIRRMIGDGHRSEELFQEVFLAVWQKRRQYQYPRPFRTWLFAIATNRCRADFRRAAQVNSWSIDQSPSAAPVDGALEPLEAAVAVETNELVVAAVGQLPPQQRTVVVMRVFNDLPYAEIAEAIGCAETTARSYMHHALTALRRYLEPKLRDR
jgi:RNA polymerase sigma-70 factor (ECF subfamily)